ncbi:MAG: stress-responsive transcription factor hsf1, partial [Watsoniomyces obsoletus]
RLAKLQAEQDKSVQNLTNLLQPLSPTGSIPGIHDGASLPPPPLDIDDFLNHNEYFNDFPSDGAGNYDFSAAALASMAQTTMRVR